MHASRITPSIEVTIGRETRLYHAFITTAPSRLDAPATVTLHTGIALGRVRPGGGSVRIRSDPGEVIRTTRSGRRHRTRRGNAPATARSTTSSHQPIPCSSD